MTLLVKSRHQSRRALLRGALGGAAISVGLPFLDATLNDSGTALASGAPMPVRFGTWFWGLGHTPGRGFKALEGTDYRFTDECAAIEPFRQDYINYFRAFNAPLDGAASTVHFTGWVAAKTGAIPSGFGRIPAPTLDTFVAEAIGGSTRFRSIEMSCTGLAKDSYSYGRAGSHNAGEVSPLQLYLRLFGPEFRDPNAATFTPDPRLVLRQSVLSAVSAQRQALVRDAGASDKERLDQYFTAVRELENQLQVMSSAPPPLDACVRPQAPAEGTPTLQVEQSLAAHDTFSKLIAMALACDQTRVFNLLYSQAASELRAKGTTFTHHILSHEEPLDVDVGYQVETAWFNERSFIALAGLLNQLKSTREGDGTLLDNLLILAQTDTSDAKTHSVIGIPSLTIGRAGGRLKTGLAIAGNAGPISRVGLTAMRVMGVPIAEWGVKSLRTDQPITEVMA
ncbi:MAG: DUF1552 domain-containing protein [Alphaproteobacteria bacterium]|nr:DUF1552 domain-containing protein [Alphaproteobacteria bacterium]